MILRCELCGGDLELDMSAGTATCQYCQSVVSLIGMEGYEKHQKIETLMERAQIFLEDGSFGQANELFDEVLLLNGKLAKAYVGKLMVQLRCSTEKQLEKSPRELDEYPNYTRALNYANEEYKKNLIDYNTTIVNRIADEKLYKDIVNQFQNMRSQEGLKGLIGMFGGFHKEKDLYSNLKTEIERTLAQEVKIQDLMDAVNSEAEESMTNEQILLSKVYELKLLTETEISDLFYLYRRKCQWYESKCKQLKQQRAKVAAGVDELNYMLKECGFFDIQRKKELSENLQQQKEVLDGLDKELAHKAPVSANEMTLLEIMLNSQESKGYTQPIEDYKIDILKQLYEIGNDAEAALNKQDYDKVKELLRMEIIPSRIHKQNERYQQVLEDIKNREFGKAFAELVYLYQYKKASELFHKCMMMQGACIRLGQYRWRVLDKKDNRLLLIMTHLLQDYITHEEENSQTVCWTENPVRQWLNNEFLEQSFNAQERQVIATTKIEDDKCGSYEDKVFLLSVEEADKYFINDADRQATFINSQSLGEDWNLRSMGTDTSRYAYVSNAGKLVSSGLDMVGINNGIRPAMWIEVSQ